MNEWISVEECLPKNDDEVLVWQKDYIYGDCDSAWEHYGVAHYNAKYSVWMGDWIEGRTQVLYWMPLPKPPKH